jgi:hypothetical protein
MTGIFETFYGRDVAVMLAPDKVVLNERDVAERSVPWDANTAKYQAALLVHVGPIRELLAARMRTISSVSSSSSKSSMSGSSKDDEFPKNTAANSEIMYNNPILKPNQPE